MTAAEHAKVWRETASALFRHGCLKKSEPTMAVFELASEVASAYERAAQEESEIATEAEMTTTIPDDVLHEFVRYGPTTARQMARELLAAREQIATLEAENQRLSHWINPPIGTGSSS